MSKLNLGKFELSTDHASSNYGIPLIVAENGAIYGIGDILPESFGHSDPAVHVAAASMLRGKRQHPLVRAFLAQAKANHPRRRGGIKMSTHAHNMDEQARNRADLNSVASDGSGRRISGLDENPFREPPERTGWVYGPGMIFMPPEIAAAAEAAYQADGAGADMAVVTAWQASQ